VRYHSLVIDAASLPEDLIPTAWTMLSDAPGVDCANGSSTSGLCDGKFWMTGRPAGSSGRSQEIVLMGMSHRNRPHHGVQVPSRYASGSYENLRIYSDSEIFQSPLFPILKATACGHSLCS